MKLHIFHKKTMKALDLIRGLFFVLRYFPFLKFKGIPFSRGRVQARPFYNKEKGTCFKLIFGKGNGFGRNICLMGESEIILGDHVHIHDNSMISASERIVLGDWTLVGPFCNIRDSDHEFSDREKPISTQGMSGKPITIGRDVWLAAHVSVLKGVTIGDGAVIGAGAIVTKDIPPYAIAVGNPARVVGYRGDSK